MGTKLYRAQILLRPEQHRAIVEIARREGRSISEVVREMIEAQLQQRAQGALARQLEAMERIRKHREEMLAQRGGKPLDIDTVTMIEQVREEQDERNPASIGGHCDYTNASDKR